MFIDRPLSTSKHIEVAIKFSKEQGMILEMDNSKGYSRFLKGMNCPWISRYKEEERRSVLCINFIYINNNNNDKNIYIYIVYFLEVCIQ